MNDLDPSLTRANLIRRLELSWQELITYFASLTEEQLSVPSDAAGWTAKDHIIHLAAWEKAGMALFDGKTKRETLEISPEVWELDDDPINAVLQERYRDLSWAEVLQTFQAQHEATMAKLNSLSEEELLLPYSHYQPSYPDEKRPIIRWVFGDTIHHYNDHMPWIAAIVAKD